jgi:hypothetical protein
VSRAESSLTPWAIRPKENEFYSAAPAALLDDRTMVSAPAPGAQHLPAGARHAVMMALAPTSIWARTPRWVLVAGFGPNLANAYVTYMRI